MISSIHIIYEVKIYHYLCLGIKKKKRHTQTIALNNQVFKRSQIAELKLHMSHSSLKNK